VTKRHFCGAPLIAVLASVIPALLPLAAAQEPVAVPVESESHHHVVLANSYVHVLFVEIPAHESTLLHQHDLPYLSMPPGGADAVSAPSGAATQQGTAVVPLSYRAGGFSHAVKNPGDKPLRVVAIQLVRPQGTVRNRCAEVVRGQPKESCNTTELTATHPATHEPLLETDEMLVEHWEVAPNSASAPLDDRLDMLIAGITGVSVTGGPGIDSANELRGGALWIPAGSKPVFKTSADGGGRFIAISFKDSGAGKH
jgi:hypothetical protein